MIGAVARGLDFMGRYAAPLLATSVFLGLLLPPFAALLRPLLVVFFLVPMVISLMRIDWSALGAYARRPVMIAAMMIWSLIASPLLMWLVLAGVGLPKALETALVLMAAAPPIGAAAAFALILGLDAPLMVVVVVATLLATPFTLPPMALWLLGLHIDIGLVEFIGRLVALIGGTFVAAYLARRWVEPAWLVRNATRLDGLSVLSLGCFAIAIMDGVTDVLLSRPGFFFLCMAVAFAANIGLQIAGAGAFARLGRSRALSVGLMSGNCNMGLVVAVLADRADFDVVVFFALGQIPMYTLPALLLPVYRRLLRP
jgi:BASS family bile acid:Na+ symporter